MDIHNSQFGADIEYKSLDIGTPAWAVKTGPAAIPAIPEGNPTIIVEETFDTGSLWDQITFGGFSGTGVWATDASTFHSSPNSFLSPNISSGESGTFTVYNDTFSSDLIFWARVDTGNIIGSLVNGLVVTVDGTEKLVVADFDTGWVKYTIGLNFGYQVDFTYRKDFSSFTNKVWVDNIIFGFRGTSGVPGSPAHPLVYSPLYLCGDDNRLLVSPALQVTVEVPEQIVATEDFETDPITGSGDWFLTTSSPHTGTRCLRSKVITNSETTDWIFTVPATATSIRFWDRVSSENNFDWFRVYKDIVDPGNLLYQQSGTANTWTQHTFDITGSISIIFRYSKDSSDSAGLDAAFIDDIEWIIPAIPASEVCAPFRLNSDGEIETRPLTCETDSVTICQGGPLTVTVLNPTPTVSGTVPVSGTVNVGNFPAVAHLNCVTDSVEICNDAGSPITVSGTVNVGNIPHVIVDAMPVVVQGTSPWVISGAVTVSDGSGPLTVDGTVAATQSGSWTVTANQGTSPWVISGAVTVSDGSGPLTVDGTVAAAQSGVWSTGRTWDLNFGVDQVDVSGSSVVADTNFDYPEDSPHVSGNPGAFILAVRNDDPLNVLTSADGDYSPIGVTSTGRVQTTDRGNFAEDTPHTSGHFGEFILAVRNDDPLNVLTDNNGDYSPISVTSTGRVQTTDRSNFAEDTAASSGHFGAFVLGVRNDSAAVKTDTDGDYSQISVDSSGRVGISDLGGSITVDGSVTVSGTVSVSNMNIQHTEDTPVVSGDIGHLVLVMRHDASTGTVDADGDYSALHVNAFGQLKVDIGGQTVNIGSLPSSTQAFPNATISTVAGSATSVTLLASNANRRKVYLTNESLSVARIAFGSAASATNYTIVLLANQTYVIEYPCYTGAMNVIWDLAVGNMRVTEVTT